MSATTWHDRVIESINRYIENPNWPDIEELVDPVFHGLKESHLAGWTTGAMQPKYYGPDFEYFLMSLGMECYSIIKERHPELDKMKVITVILMEIIKNREIGNLMYEGKMVQLKEADGTNKFAMRDEAHWNKKRSRR